MKMILAEADLEIALILLKRARQAARRLMGPSPDWTSKIEIESGFDDLEKECREWARLHLGIVLENSEEDVPPIKRKQKKGKRIPVAVH